MSQHDMTIDNASGATARADINLALQALASSGKGNTRPATPFAGQLWIDDNTPSATVWTLFMYDGSDDIAAGYFDTTNNGFHLARPATNYTTVAGSIGEQFTAAASVALVSSTGKTVTSLTLTAGVWDVEGVIDINPLGSSTQQVASISLVNNTIGVVGDPGLCLVTSGAANGLRCALPTGTRRVSVPVSTTTTVYLVAQSNFSTSTCAASGTITATRA